MPTEDFSSAFRKTNSDEGNEVLALGCDLAKQGVQGVGNSRTLVLVELAQTDTPM